MTLHDSYDHGRLTACGQQTLPVILLVACGSSQPPALP